jgi:cell division protein FtsW
VAEQTSDGAAAPTEAARTPRRRDLPGEGQLLLLITLGLTAVGQVMVYSASSPVAMTTARYGNDPLYFVKNGVVFTIAGVLLMLLVMRMPVSLFKSLTPLALVVSLLLLVAVMVPGVGATINGARRWIAVGPITVQPSELAKLALLGTVAALLAAKKTAPQRFGELMKPIGLLTGVVCALVLAEPDLGSALAIALMVGAMLIVAGVPGRLFGAILGIALTLGGIAIWFEPYRRDRLFAFLNPEAHASDGSYQVLQGIIGFASGGAGGVGLGESIQKVYYVPEAHTDMIFAIIGEELGLAGSLMILAGFAAFAWAGFTIALRARDRFSQLVAVGTTALIAGQAAINVGAVTGILPLTGIPLPLVSYGSSSKVSTLLMVGVVLAVCREGRTAEELAAEKAARRTARGDRRAEAVTKTAEQPRRRRATAR